MNKSAFQVSGWTNIDLVEVYHTINNYWWFVGHLSVPRRQPETDHGKVVVNFWFKGQSTECSSWLHTPLSNSWCRYLIMPSKQQLLNWLCYRSLDWTGGLEPMYVDTLKSGHLVIFPIEIQDTSLIRTLSVVPKVSVWVLGSIVFKKLW